MKKRNLQPRPPDPQADRAQLIRVSRHDIQDLMEDPAPLENLAALARTLEEAREKKS